MSTLKILLYGAWVCVDLLTSEPHLTLCTHLEFLSLLACITVASLSTNLHFTFHLNSTLYYQTCFCRSFFFISGPFIFLKNKFFFSTANINSTHTHPLQEWTHQIATIATCPVMPHESLAITIAAPLPLEFLTEHHRLHWIIQIKFFKIHLLRATFSVWHILSFNVHLVFTYMSLIYILLLLFLLTSLT